MLDLILLVQQITEKLSAQHLLISTAESCTGGLIASLLTELPGSSKWFDRGFVTYSNLAKEQMLRVDTNLIQKYGAVSQPVAEAMVVGALNNSQANIAVAVTGIAGPGGGCPQKPVGTVYIAWGMRNSSVLCRLYNFRNFSRQLVRYHACHTALAGIIPFINDNIFY